MRTTHVFLAIALLGCGTVSNATQPDASSGDAPPGMDGSSGSGGGDAPTARCDPAKPFGTPTLVDNINTSNEETSFALTRDELTGFIGNVVQPPTPSATIAVTTRRSATAAFGTPSRDVMSAINGTAGDEHGPSPVADGLIVYFHRQVNAVIGPLAATRPTAQSKFSGGTGVTVGGKQLLDALSVHISDDGQTLYWLDINDFIMHSATRGLTPTSFSAERVASSIPLGNSPVLSADELTLFYSNGFATDILESTRPNKAATFGTGVPVANINSPQNEYPVFLTHDGCVLYLASNRPGGIGGFDIWEARRPL